MNSLDLLLKDFFTLRHSASNYYYLRDLDCAIKSYKGCIEKIQYIKKSFENEIKTLFININYDIISVNDFLIKEELSFKLMLGISYMQKGLNFEAISALSPFVDSKNKTGDSYDIYHCLTVYTEIAQKIPLDYSKVDHVYLDVEKYLSTIGKNHWSHEYLVKKSRYEFLKNNFEKAFLLAKEALNIKITSLKNNDRYEGQVWDYHYDGLIIICLALGKISEAKIHIDEWINKPDQMEMNRLVRMNKCLADITRFERNYTDSIEYAKRAVNYSDSTDYEETKFSSICSLIYVYIESGNINDAKKTFSKLFQLRNSERLFIKYQIFLILYKFRILAESKQSKILNTEKTLKSYSNNIDSLLGISHYSNDLNNINKTLVY